ncbi:MAG TPA: ferritin-like domain-containing protein [Pilimelia sp.]|nr:ferritin-like domain-containing protein [Pilimelia sp.]
MNALSAALAGEHAAIFAYGPIGVRLDRAAAAQARAAEKAHRDRRDAVLLQLATATASPPPPAPAYALPFAVTDRAGALRLAAEVEERTAALWRAALRETTGTQRQFALDALVDCAVRATRWRRVAGASPATVPFPGKPD